MDDALARQLAALTNRFYEKAARSFSATRQQPWQGWELLWHEAAPLLGAARSEHPLRVLDVGCGNLRFVRFLASKAPSGIEAWGVDSCPALMAEGAVALDADADADAAQDAEGIPAPAPHAHLRQMDVAAALLDGAAPDALARGFDAPPADLVVAFGLLHHMPTADARGRLMRALVQAVRPGGLVAVTLWQFAADPRLRAKAEQATARGCAQLGLPPLPAGDYLMGWQDDENAFRYCHSFAEEEVDALAATASIPGAAASVHGAAEPDSASSMAPRLGVGPLAAREVARFSADGKSGDLNRYLLLQRTE